MTFLGERAPPLMFLLLSAGPCLSGLVVVEEYVNKEKFAWALLGELVSGGCWGGNDDGVSSSSRLSILI